VFSTAARTLCSMRCPIWPSADAASATATRHAVVCRHATDDSVASVDTIQSAQTAKGADLSTTTDRGPEECRLEQTNVFVSSSGWCYLMTNEPMSMS